MSDYRVYGTAQENGIAVSCLIVVYKAGRGGYIAEAGQELGRQVTGANGKFDIYYSGWNKDVFLVCLDLTESPQRYEGVVVDWLKAEYLNDPYIDKVVTLLHMDGANNGTVFTDQIATNSYAAVGSAVTSTADQKFGSASLYLDGSSRIQTPYTPAFNIWDQEFCFEAWVKRTVATTYQVLFDTRGVTGYGPILIRVDSGVVKVWMSGTNTSWAVSSHGTVALVLNAWTHIAVLRHNGAVKIYHNGVLGSSISNSTTLMNGLATNAVIGGASDGQNFNGYMDEVRLTIGNPRYTANFTPLGIPFKDSVQDPYFPYVKSLVHFDGANNGTVFSDVIGNAVTIDLGAPVTSTADFKFGGSSLLLNGTSIVHVAHAPDMEINDQDWTVEMWAKSTVANTTTYRYILDKRLDAGGGGNGYGAFIIRSYGGYWQIYVRNGLAAWVALPLSTIPFTINTWHHVAVSRSLGKIRFFLNGVKVWDLAFTTPMYDDDYPLEFGRTWIGSIDEFRYTVGVARYIENFSVQTLPHPNS